MSNRNPSSVIDFMTQDVSIRKPFKQQKVTKFKSNSHSGKSRQCKSIICKICLAFVVLFSITAFILSIIAITRNNDSNSISSPMVSSSFVKSPLEGENYTIVIPSSATKLTQNLYYLGQSTNNKRQVMNGYLYVHRVPSEYQSLQSRLEDYDSNSSFAMSECFGTYARGAKWKRAKDFVIDTSNNQGLSSDFIIDTFLAVMRSWTDAAESVQFFGNRIDKNSVHTNGGDLSQPDGYNEIRFGNIGEPGVVAATIVWGFFDNQVSSREIIEADQIYNQRGYCWGDARIKPRCMHLLGIGKHEFGHWLGLRDMYDSHCSEVTMYGYSSPGETKKETLEASDIIGICYLYESCRNHRQ